MGVTAPDPAVIEQTLDQHPYIYSGLRGVSRCGCGVQFSGMPHLHRAHVAERIAEALTAPRKRNRTATSGAPTSVRADVEGEHVGGCNDQCSGNSHHLTGFPDAVEALREVSERGTPGLWVHEHVEDVDECGNWWDATSTVSVWDEDGIVMQFDAATIADAALIVAAVNDLRERLRTPGTTEEGQG